MRRRQARDFGEAVGELLRDNTFGGSREGRHARKHQIPVITTEEGIKIEWDGCREEYPPVVKLKMTDGQWRTYRLHAEQPVFSPALEELEKMKRGRPRRRTTMEKTITRKSVLLECLEWLRGNRNSLSRRGLGQSALPGMLDQFCDAQAKVDIMMDVIHYLDTDAGRMGMADWQRKEMQDPEKCRREAMRFAEG